MADCIFKEQLSRLNKPKLIPLKEVVSKENWRTYYNKLALRRSQKHTLIPTSFQYMPSKK